MGAGPVMDETIQQLVKPRVHQQAVETIARAILRGDFAATGYLPPEPQLCETLQISRSAVREAVKVLGGKGLVSARPHVGTMIRPRDEWNMLDSDLLAWSIEVKPDAKVVMSLIEARQVIEPAAARLAAQRATAADLAAIERAFLGMSAAREANDFAAYNAADKDFHTAMLGASHNFVFRQLATTIGAALAYSFRITSRELGHALPIHREVMERIRMRDADGASAAMLRLLDIAIRDLNQHGHDMGSIAGPV
jgi:GntR family transcriptional regulator, galactonate operon transcriptional repressor